MYDYAQENKMALLILQTIPQPWCGPNRTEERAKTNLHIIEAKPNIQQAFDKPLIIPQEG